MRQGEPAKRNRALEKRKKGSTGVPGIFSIIGGAALVLVAAAVIVSLPDIKRYIRISTM